MGSVGWPAPRSCAVMVMDSALTAQFLVIIQYTVSSAIIGRNGSQKLATYAT